MHDPYTLVFDWPRSDSFAYRLTGTLVTLWHRDRGGADGACGWSYPHLAERQLKQIRQWAWGEGWDPYFLRCPGKQFNGSRTEAETLYRALVLETARALQIKISIEEATRWAIQRVHMGGVEDGARVFCWQPGYHTNSPDDSAKSREDHFFGIMCAIARELLRRRRHWYRHPRWHVHHWRVSLPFSRRLRRWLFARCALCGDRFEWGYSPSTDYDGRRLWHTECVGRGGGRS